MTAFVNLFRTTAFKLALIYSIVFAIAAGAVFESVGWNARKVIDEQIADTVDADIRGLNDQYAQGGIQQVVQSIERRLTHPGDDIYLVTTFNGDPVVGNIANLPPIAFSNAELTETTYHRTNDANATRRALVRVFILPGGFKLLVGQDIEERENLQRVFNRALSSSLIWLVLIGAAGGLVIARRVLNRVDDVSASAKQIMNGDLSKRLPVIGTGDELDRLAQNLNEMLARITELMGGLRTVSDNIAHDLRTPLTRLRNRAEQALRSDGDAAHLKAALEKVIDESDGMIRIFDALLMIARAEAGAGAALGKLDAAAIVRDIGELYEAAAEDEGVALSVEANGSAWVEGNRELISQALANLVDNALKYGAVKDTSGGKTPVRSISIGAKPKAGRLEIFVGDRGPGIAAEDRARVLDRFVRLETSRSLPGSGLGLSLVNAVARLHNGELRLEDNRPGLRAILDLPLALPPAAVLPAPPQPAPPLQSET